MISRLFLIIVLLLSCPLYGEDLSPVRVSALTCEHLQNPIGIGAKQPRLSWKILSDRMGEVQTAYQIRAVFGRRSGCSQTRSLGLGQNCLGSVRAYPLVRHTTEIRRPGVLAGPHLG